MVGSEFQPFALRVIVRSVAAATLLLLTLSLIGCGAEPGAKKTASGQVQPTGTEEDGVDITPDGRTMITLGDGSQVFGVIVESPQNATFFLSDAFFIAGKDLSDVNQLRPFGSEVHRPEQVLIIPWTSVAYQEPLGAESAAASAIEEYREANPATQTPEPELTTRSMSAVFLHSGEVYFGDLLIDGLFASLTEAHFLRFKDATATDTGAIESLDQVELIPQSQASAGSTGEMIIPLDRILYMQKLAPDSPVTAALATE